RGIVTRAASDRFAVHVDVDDSIRPADLMRGARGNQDPLAGPPILGVYDQVANTPVGLFDQHVLDMANFAVCGMDVITFDRGNAAQVRIVPVALRLASLILGRSRAGSQEGRAHDTAVAIAARIEPVAPIRVPAIVAVDAALHLPR